MSRGKQCHDKSDIYDVLYEHQRVWVDRRQPVWLQSNYYLLRRRVDPSSAYSVDSPLEAGYSG